MSHDASPSPALSSTHVSVLAEEVLAWLKPLPGQVIMDGTLGGGGHTRLLAERVTPGGLVIGIDRDPAAIEAAAKNLAGLPVRLAQANYCDAPEVLEALSLSRVDGVLLDLGLSSDQLADASRGFSFQAHGSLDMRFDPTEGKPAWRLVERLSEEHLANLFHELGEERYARRVARAIVAARHAGPLRDAAAFADLVRSAVPRHPHERVDPATRVFQALRIAVNEELKSLEIALRRLPEIIRPGGRLAVISFHSLEDRIVKEAFRGDKRYHALTKKPLTPGEAERDRNPRARSAKLRVAEIATPAATIGD